MSDHLDLEVRFATTDEGTFTGHAALFDVRNGHGEIIKRGAFAKTLSIHQGRGRTPPMLWAHDPSQPIGVWTDLREDERGLAVAGRLITETAKGREAHALLKAGALSGLSIGFRAVQAERGARGIRTLSEIELVEISLVTLPSAQGARVHSVRLSPDLATFTRAVARTAQSLRKG